MLNYMPPLRPPLLPRRYMGYVCPSCTARIQSHSIPPWLARATSTQSPATPKKRKAPREHSKSEQQKPPGHNVTIRQFDEMPDGSWEPVKDDPDEDQIDEMDVHKLRSQMKMLKDELREAKGEPTEETPFPHLPFYKEIATGKFSLLGEVEAEAKNSGNHKTRSVTTNHAKEQQGLDADMLRTAMAEMADMGTGSSGGDDGLQMQKLKALFDSVGRKSNLAEDTNPMLHQYPAIVPENAIKSTATEGSQRLDVEDLRASFPQKPVITSSGKELDVQGLLATISATSASSHGTAIPVGAFPEDRQVNILRLNIALEKRVKDDSPEKTLKELWKWYSLSRKSLAVNWRQVPADVWTVLWNGFSNTTMANPDRMPHIRKIGDDMKAAGVKMTNSQVLLYMEALFLDGHQKEAIEEWESSRAALLYESSMADEYWALGARMFANNNQPDEAQQAADILLNGSSGDKDVGVLLPIIRSWLLSSDDASVQKAWALYVRFKFLMGTKATMDDYDAITGAFLDAQQTDLALAVFRDMMLTGDASAYHHDSVAVYKRNQDSLGDLHSINFWPGETSWKSHGPFTTLIPKQRNKFFFGSWIKKLIGDGRVHSASQVLDLMYERGIPPDPRHINGIIGAWFRTGTAANQKKAEDMAWQMIVNRLNFVKVRSEKSQLTGPVRAVLNRSKNDFKRLPSSQVAVLATSETFSILVEYYQQRQKHDRVQELYDMIGAAQISPSTAFLNDMLLIGVRNQNKQWSWATYQQMIKHGVRPDHDTFGLLWQIMKAHVDPVKNRTRAGFPSCRALFAEMVMWHHVLKKDGFARDVYDLIVLCFGLADDQIGTAVTLRAMQQVFKVSPDQNTVRSVALQLAKVGLRGSGLPSRRLNLNSENKKKIAQIALILSNLKVERVKVLKQHGVNVDEMDDAQRAEESILLLCDVLRFTVQTRNKKFIEASWEDAESGSRTGSVERMGQEAAKAMGVPQCAPWGHV